jgi:hypothetical protein
MFRCSVLGQLLVVRRVTFRSTAHIASISEMFGAVITGLTSIHKVSVSIPHHL